MIKKILIAIIIVMALLIVIGLFAAGGVKEEGASSTQVQQPSTQAEPEQTVPTTASELFQTYQDNEIAGDKKFKGKLLEITGTISSIDSGLTDNAIVQLKTSNQFMSVSATGDDSFTQSAINMKKDQKITLVCRGKGEVMGMPQLSDCVVK